MDYDTSIGGHWSLVKNTEKLDKRNAYVLYQMQEVYHMRKSKSYRFKPATLTRLEILKGLYPGTSETELVEIAIDLLEDVIVLLPFRSGDFIYFKDPVGVQYKIKLVD